jgi:hypothetical protein
MEYGWAVQILFEIAGSTALAVTVFGFSGVGDEPTFWNVSQHVVNTFAMIVELFANAIVVRPEHVVFTLLWAFLYCVFTWIVVPVNAATQWPYDQMDADKVEVLISYAVAWVGFIVFFYVFYAIWCLKNVIVNGCAGHGAAGDKGHAAASRSIAADHEQNPQYRPAQLTTAGERVKNNSNSTDSTGNEQTGIVL